MTQEEMLQERAKELRRQYQREQYAKHKAKRQEYAKNYWLRKAAEALKAEAEHDS